MKGVDDTAFQVPPGGVAPGVTAAAEAADEREEALPGVAIRTLVEGESSMRLTVVHSGFGGTPQALAAPLFPMACRLAERRAGDVSGRSSFHLALVG